MNVVYNVPIELADSYENHNLILRSEDTFRLVEVARRKPANVSSVVFLRFPDDVRSLELLPGTMPMEICVGEDTSAWPLVYRLREITLLCPFRLTIPVRPGFAKAVAMATAIRAPVNLDIDQPEEELIEELREVLLHYLHNTTVAAPVEFFHSLLMSFFFNEPKTLWQIQGEDPRTTRYVADDGTLRLSKRDPFPRADEHLEMHWIWLERSLFDDGSECRACRFLECCAGYFKVPDQNYQCGGIKRILTTLWEASEELRKSHDEFRAKGEV